MREIKFRAKHADTNEWVYGLPRGITEHDFKTFHSMQSCDVTGYWGYVPIKPETLGQYTGLKDKNGVEVYESDIIKHPLGIIAKIEYDEGFCAFIACYEIDEKKYHDLLERKEVVACSVIGSIHPELLEESK